MLVRLLYASRAVDTSAQAIEAILTQSRQHNPGSGITGVLCYGGGVFLQAIEGGRSAVSELYGHIQRDPRHKNVELLHYEEIAERRFGGWTMGQVNLSKPVFVNIVVRFFKQLSAFFPSLVSLAPARG